MRIKKKENKHNGVGGGEEKIDEKQVKGRKGKGAAKEERKKERNISRKAVSNVFMNLASF